MAYEYNHNSSGSGDNSDLISWIIVVAALVIFWPVGLFLLFRKLTGNPVGSSGTGRTRSQHPYDIEQDAAGPYTKSQSSNQSAQKSSTAEDKGGAYSYNYKYQYRYQPQGQPQGQSQARQQPKSSYKSKQTAPGMQGVPNAARYKYRKPVDLNKGKAMTIWGGILTGIFGLSAITTIPLMLMEGGFGAFFAAGTPILGFLSLGIILMVTGSQRTRKVKRFRKYLALIGKRESIAISSLAQAMPVSYRNACDDLQEMLDKGYIPTGYLDMNSGRLILSDEGLREEQAQPASHVETEPEEEIADNSTLLDEISQINDSIADVDMSQKIDRIREITAKILEYQRKNPSKAGQLRSFLSYYLPTTLKILRAYAQMEAQGIEGENIRAAKNRIEGMMDKVVEGFEKQLDKLFQDDAMDITTDVEVLERMLDKDGLSGAGDMFQMGG